MRLLEAMKQTRITLAAAALALLLPWLLSACNGPAADDGAQIRVLEPKLLQNGELALAAGIDMRLGDEVLEALHSGIPIVISVDLRLGRRYRYFAREIDTRSQHWVLNYLPLSERYTLEHAVSGDINSYPRLRTLLADLRQPVRYPWTQQANRSAAWTDGRHQLQVRVRLNRLRLPAPLRLPALISSQWRLQDGWHTLWITASNNPAAAQAPAAVLHHTPQGPLHAL